MVTKSFEWREAPPGDFAVIGDPVSHSRSPQMHAAAFAVAGLTATYRAIHVVPGEVAATLTHLARLGYAGVNITVPHKAEARAAMRSVDPFAERCDSVNTIRLVDFHAINTDGAGFLDTLSGLVPSGCRVLLLGAGGSARAIALALALDGYRLTIFNRTRKRALALVRELGIDAKVVEKPELQDADLIVNATSASLHCEALPVGLDFTQRRNGARVVAYDLVYGETPFLKAARKAGLVTIDGKQLLVAQGARSLEFWLPEVWSAGTAPREAMLEAVEEPDG
jgi:shikimate dehydrogenase